MAWLGLLAGVAAPLLWLQYHNYHSDPWWFYLIMGLAAVVSAIGRTRYGAGRYGTGVGWSNTGGWNNFSWGGDTSPRRNLLLPGARLTAPPMPDPAQTAADRYQQLLNDWLTERGMSPLNSDHLRLAMQANPYSPALVQLPAVPDAMPAAASTAQTPPQQALELLWLYDKSWWVAGGWALDLWLGHQTREHKDLEIAIPRADQFELRAFMSQFRFMQVAAGSAGKQELALPLTEWVEQPAHELHAHRVTGASVEPLPLLHLEVLLNEIEGGVWHYRRDLRVSLPVERLGGQSQDGVPYLAPELVLLYKAGLWRDGAAVQAHDDADFRQALPLLSPAQQHWLREAIATAHPGHPWLLQLNTRPYGN